ncbi:hypothetical protein [Cylindrospermopsis raciborskii]|nr:hypothetical protein [Cylindrospermopsis raciborskii]
MGVVILIGHKIRRGSVILSSLTCSTGMVTDTWAIAFSKSSPYRL